MKTRQSLSLSIIPRGNDEKNTAHEQKKQRGQAILHHSRLLLLRFPHRSQHVRERYPSQVSILFETLSEEIFQFVCRRPPHVHPRLNLGRLSESRLPAL